MPIIRPSVLEKLNWEYSLRDDGTPMRFAVYEDELITQRRVTLAETSRRKLLNKALQGEYDLTDMTVKGTGNSYLVIGWETTNLSDDFDNLLLAA